jgi:hypothetical protein
MVRSERSRYDYGSTPPTDGGAISPPRPLPPRVKGRSGFQVTGTRRAYVPPPLPRVAEPPNGAIFPGEHRSQPPPRKRRSGSARALPPPVPPRGLRSSPKIPAICSPLPLRAAERCLSESPPPNERSNLRDLGAPGLEFDRSMSALAVSNDVSSESLWPPTSPGLGAWSRRASAWLASFARWRTDGLYWFLERAAWQRGVISLAIGALLGIGIVLVTAGLTGTRRAELPASAAPPQALVQEAGLGGVSAPAVLPVAAIPAPSLNADPTAPAASLVAVPTSPAPEPLLEKTHPKRASKTANTRRSRPRSHARSRVGTWIFPRPQRR